MAKNKSDRPRDMANDIIGLVQDGTKKWTKTKKAEERSPASRFYRYSRMTRERGVSAKEAAAQIMEKAYLKASGDGQYPANARQIMYAARPHIQMMTGKQLEPNYFTQTLLPDYLQESGADWMSSTTPVGISRNHMVGKALASALWRCAAISRTWHEPRILDADFSQAKVETSGPNGNFGAVLFVEKEGFDPLLKKTKIADKFDIAIMSTKGMSVTAARELADKMCHDYDIPLLLLHDFDKAGFSIAGTLQRDTRRYEFQNSITTVDLGLNLEDVRAMTLESEYQHHPKGDKAALMANLRENGASDEEIAFMFRDFDRLRSTRRVELNAMTSPQFIAFVERKLRANGVAKIVPDQELLAEMYVGFEKGRRLQKAVEEALDDIDDDFNAPRDLQQRVRKYLKEHPQERWDKAISAIVAERNR